VKNKKAEINGYYQSRYPEIIRIAAFLK